MKNILILVFVNTAFVGCSNSTPAQHDNLQTVSPQKIEYQKKIQNKDVKSEAIVVFKKGVTVQTAKEIIEAYGMHVLKVYKNISVSTNMPMFHIRSSLPTQKMMQLLGKNTKVSSVSPDHVRHLEDK